jgi:hypothetical protein
MCFIFMFLFLEYLKFLRETTKCGLTFELSAAAASGGNLECLKYLTESGGVCTVSASWNAALRGFYSPLLSPHLYPSIPTLPSIHSSSLFSYSLCRTFGRFEIFTRRRIRMGHNDFRMRCAGRQPRMFTVCFFVFCFY